MNTPLSYEKLVNALSQLPPRPPLAEVWISNHLPDGQVYKLMLKDLPSIYNFKGYAQGTEEIYLLNPNDYSMELSQILRNIGIPVFTPSGEKLC